MKKLKYFRTRKMIAFGKFLFVAKIVVSLVILAGIVIIAIDAVNHIEAEGLKNILLPLWEGKS